MDDRSKCKAKTIMYLEKQENSFMPLKQTISYQEKLAHNTFKKDKLDIIKMKNFQLKDMLKKWKDKQRQGKHAQYIHLTKDLCPDYFKNT